ncbi:MAG: universal stress protein UspA-like protein [Actinomycetia bacterium]|nr:universal stress protein UspA-like protein [Actinomycetes bacterium]
MHVLIATDGSPLSIAAARRGIALLAQPTAVTLLTVITEVPGDDAGGFEGSVYSPEEQQRLWEAEQHNAAVELADTAAALTGCEVQKRMELGDVATTICRVAEELPADAIVMGSHGRTGLKRMLLGSVSEHVVRHAPCPVLVVHERPEQ